MQSTHAVPTSADCQRASSAAWLNLASPVARCSRFAPPWFGRINALETFRKRRCATLVVGESPDGRGLRGDQGSRDRWEAGVVGWPGDEVARLRGGHPDPNCRPETSSPAGPTMGRQSPQQGGPIWISSRSGAPRGPQRRQGPSPGFEGSPGDEVARLRGGLWAREGSRSGIRIQQGGECRHKPAFRFGRIQGSWLTRKGGQP